jgi:hypothetical protein
MPYILKGQVLPDDDPRVIAARQQASRGATSGGGGGGGGGGGRLGSINVRYCDDFEDAEATA